MAGTSSGKYVQTSERYTGYQTGSIRKTGLHQAFQVNQFLLQKLSNELLQHFINETSQTVGDKQNSIDESHSADLADSKSKTSYHNNFEPTYLFAN